ncbi:hypothetical protein ACJZ2D_014210 [Fusarium nematophilum]
MSSRIADASWPSAAVSTFVQGLLDNFLTLMDDPSDEAATKLATQIFTPEASLISSLGKARGTDEIRQSRKKAWELTTSRYHKIVKVYSATDDGADLLFIGQAKLVLKIGKTIEGDFIGRAIIDNTNESSPRLQFFQSWGVCLPSESSTLFDYERSSESTGQWADDHRTTRSPLEKLGWSDTSAEGTNQGLAQDI